jgi:hypothetical protein
MPWKAVRTSFLSCPSSSGRRRISAKIFGLMVGDNITKWDETAGLLYVDSPSAESIRLTGRVRVHAHMVGRPCANELSRRRDRRRAYEPWPQRGLMGFLTGS